VFVREDAMWTGESTRCSRSTAYPTAAILAVVVLTWTASGHRALAAGERLFPSPEDAVTALHAAAKSGGLDAVIAIFGSEGKGLIDSSDEAAARRNRDVFAAAMNEGWRLEDVGPARKTLIVGNEQWPFPVPLVKEGNAWRFDTAAGREEVLARRIGRNELTAIRLCHTYVRAQRLYARDGHDTQGAGAYAAKFRSDPGTQNGLYWPDEPGVARSPLGDLVAEAAAEGRTIGGDGSAPAPFHGYYFRILTGQGAAAPGGARSYVVNGRMTGGFALVAWPAVYDETGVMTFIVNHDGVVHEKDLGADTGTAARAMTGYDPDPSWVPVD
jgi:hypothetical protein